MDTTRSSRARNGQFGRIITAASAAGLVIYGLRRRDLRGALFALTGVGIAARGPLRDVTRRARELSNEPVSIVSSITIRNTLDEVYTLLRSPDGIFESVESMEPRLDGSTRWTVNLRGFRMVVDGRIDSEQRPRELRFRAQETGHLQGAGSIELRPAPGEQGTEVRVRLALLPTSRPLRLPAHALRRAARLAIFNELIRVRQLAETGEIATGAMRIPGGEERERSLPEREATIPAPAHTVAQYSDLLPALETE